MKGRKGNRGTKRGRKRRERIKIEIGVDAQK